MSKGNGGSISVINPSGASLVVTITRGTATPVAYTTEALSATHTMPLTITDDETFWFADAGEYTVSVTQAGNEIANGVGGTKTIPLVGGCGVGFTPSGQFGASSADLTQLDADNLVTGTVNGARLPIFRTLDPLILDFTAGPVASGEQHIVPVITQQAGAPFGALVAAIDDDVITLSGLPCYALVLGQLWFTTEAQGFIVSDVLQHTLPITYPSGVNFFGKFATLWPIAEDDHWEVNLLSAAGGDLPYGQIAIYPLGEMF